MTTEERAYKHPLLWVPSSYFMMGTVWVTVTTMSNIVFLNLGLSVAQAASYSSLLGIPYIFKPLWAPLLELYGTKKIWVIGCQLVLAGILAATAFALQLPNPTFVAPVVGLLAFGGFVGATMDIGSDGVYVTTLPAKEQARFTGFQSMSWSIGPIVATGLFVWLSGKLHETMSYALAWLIIFLILAALLVAASFLHMRALPTGAKAEDAPESFGAAMKTFGTAFATFFQKKSILTMVAFAFLFRFSIGLLDKIGPAFLIDSRLSGGIGLTNEQLGMLNGIVGTTAFIVGSLLGGWFVSRSKRGLIGVIFVLALCLNIPNLTFLYMGIAQPSNTEMSSFSLIAVLVFIEKFGWGFGAVGHMLYMMQQIAPGKFKTAHYAFATGFMGLCYTSTGLISGWVVEGLGYEAFFWVVLAAAAPSLLATLGAPFIHAEDDPEHDGKKRFALSGAPLKLAIVAVVGVAVGASVFVFQNGSAYAAERKALAVDEAACLEKNDRRACFYQCKGEGGVEPNAKACKHLSDQFLGEASLKNKAAVEAMDGDAGRAHQYKRSEAFTWYKKGLELRCEAKEAAACKELGDILVRPENADLSNKTPCAEALKLNESRAAWCDTAAPDDDAANGYYAKACEAGDKDSCNKK